jgi:hypothetical protein
VLSIHHRERPDVLGQDVPGQPLQEQDTRLKALIDRRRLAAT